MLFHLICISCGLLSASSFCGLSLGIFISHCQSFMLKEMRRESKHVRAHAIRLELWRKFLPLNSIFIVKFYKTLRYLGYESARTAKNCLAPFFLSWFQMFVGLLFWFQFYCGFSASAMIDQWYLIFFNLLFSSLPQLVTGVLDKDVPAEVLLTEPQLYKSGQNMEVRLLSCPHLLLLGPPTLHIHLQRMKVSTPPFKWTPWGKLLKFWKMTSGK